jgi:predicted phage terminase large subunit-like protein
MPGAVQVLAQTRWHEDDLAGRILNSAGANEWTVLNLPAIAEEGDPLGRKPGEALWPEWFPIKDLPSVAKGEITSRAFSALYQQTPVPAEGRLFKMAWMDRRYDLRSRPRFDSLVQSVDSAWKTGPGNDFSCIATWGTDGKDYYLVDCWHGRVEFPELRRIVLEQYEKHRPHAVIVEQAAAGFAVVQELQQMTKLPIIGIPAKGSKESRAEAVTPYFEAGKVLLPVGMPWLEDWINEHLRFPAGKHDDQVDTTSLALCRLSQYSHNRPYAVQVIPGQRDASLWRSGSQAIMR